MIAALEARRAGLLGRDHWTRNLVSGAIVGVVALPLAMAFAIASGAKPEQGLYTAILSGFVVSVFGGSRVQIAGPTGAFIVVLSDITARHGIGGLQVATLMAGVMLVGLGVARLGAVVKFMPDPVIVGFTAGIGLTIFVGQWRDFFGLSQVTGHHFHEKLWHLARSLPHLHPATTALGCVALLAVLASPLVPGLRRIPGPLVALVLGTALQAGLQLEGVATIGSAFGGIPRGLPTPSLPAIDPDGVIELIGPAFTIAMLGAIESLLSAVVADGMAGTRHDSNQELIGQGLANILAPLFGGFAATGAIARTATNIRNGGTSPIAGIVHSVTLLLVLLFLAPLAASIPLCVLAAILFVVAWNMSEARHFAKIVRRAPRGDVVILLLTFALTVFADLVVAVNIGVILATLNFLRRMAASVEVAEVSGDELAQRSGLELPKDVLVYSVEGPFFFGAVEKFERAMASTHSDPRVLVLRLGWVPFVDATALETLEEAIHGLKRRGVVVLLVGANPRVEGQLEKAEILELVGRENVFGDLASALEASETRRSSKRPPSAHPAA